MNTPTNRLATQLRCAGLPLQQLTRDLDAGTAGPVGPHEIAEATHLLTTLADATSRLVRAANTMQA